MPLTGYVTLCDIEHNRNIDAFTLVPNNISIKCLFWNDVNHEGYQLPYDLICEKFLCVDGKYFRLT